jgi:16S rRNA (cytosine1402-N4)-methyltransferase
MKSSAFRPALQPSGAILVDATLGRAGHARALLEAHPGLALIGVDTDTQALEESGACWPRTPTG